MRHRDNWWPKHLKTERKGINVILTKLFCAGPPKFSFFLFFIIYVLLFYFSRFSHLRRKLIFTYAKIQKRMYILFRSMVRLSYIHQRNCNNLLLKMQEPAGGKFQLPAKEQFFTFSK